MVGSFSLVCSGSSRNVTESFMCASDRKWPKDPEIDRPTARGGVGGGGETQNERLAAAATTGGNQGGERG